MNGSRRQSLSDTPASALSGLSNAGPNISHDAWVVEGVCVGGGGGLKEIGS